MNRKATEELCKIYYNEKKLNHVTRVANKAEHLSELFYPKASFYHQEASIIYYDIKDFIYKLGLAHDLYESTDITKGVWFDNKFEQNLQLLTRNPEEDYINYIEKIKKFTHENNEYFLPAYIVKLADIWDHLNQTDTLTEKRKEKYLKALPYFF